MMANPAQSVVHDVIDDAHRDILARLDELAALMERLDAGTPVSDVRDQASSLIAFFSGPARDHNYEEELYVFPRLLASADVELKRAAEDLCEDHARIELCWLEIEPQLGLLAGGGCARDLSALREAVETLVDVTREHVALEEALIYPHHAPIR